MYLVHSSYSLFLVHYFYSLYFYVHSPNLIVLRVLGVWSLVQYHQSLVLSLQSSVLSS